METRARRNIPLACSIYFSLLQFFHFIESVATPVFQQHDFFYGRRLPVLIFYQWMIIVSQSYSLHGDAGPENIFYEIPGIVSFIR